MVKQSKASVVPIIGLWHWPHPSWASYKSSRIWSPHFKLVHVTPRPPAEAQQLFARKQHPLEFSERL
jgi:hypothetical protein